MRNLQSPIVIAGCGCAGLSLAYHLVCNPKFSTPLILIDPRHPGDFINDRTWCAFGTRAHPFTDLISNSWHEWETRSEGVTAVASSAPYPYTCLRADAFYQRCFKAIKDHPGVTALFGHNAHVSDANVEAAPVDGGPAVSIHASHVFDSRPSRASPDHNAGEVALIQQFVGIEIQTTRDVFAPARVTLMDFLPGDKSQIRFMYVLPFTARTALIECTAFVKHQQDLSTFDKDIETYIRKRYQLDHWTVTRRETGAIPMTTLRTDHRSSPNVTRIGIAGGLAKPSTGYAFNAIQEHSARIATSLAKGRLDDRRPGGFVALVLDRIFLSYLARYPERAADLFVRIANGTRGDRFARFMMNHATAADNVAMIASMPKWPFIYEALRSPRLWITGRSKVVAPASKSVLNRVSP